MKDINQILIIDDALACFGVHSVDDFLKLTEVTSEDIAVILLVTRTRRPNRLESFQNFGTRIQNILPVHLWKKIPLFLEIVNADDAIAILGLHKNSFLDLVRKVDENVAITLLALYLWRTRYSKHLIHVSSDEANLFLKVELTRLIPVKFLNAFRMDEIEFRKGMEELLSAWNKAQVAIRRASRPVHK